MMFSQTKPVDPHCMTCGQAAQATAENQGYSDCCNDRICDGTSRDRYAIGTWNFQTDERTVTGHAIACCGPKAEAANPGLHALYREI